MDSKYENLVAHYAKWVGLPPHGLSVGYVEELLSKLLEKGAEDQYPDYMLVALAGAAGSFASLEAAAIDEEGFETINLLSETWLAAKSHLKWSWDDSEGKDPLFPKEAGDFLKTVLKEYFPDQDSILDSISEDPFPDPEELYLQGILLDELFD